MPHRIYIIEDHPLVRQTLSDFVTLAGNLDVVGTADSAEAALEWFNGDLPDLVLVDVSLPGMTGLQLIERLHERWPELPCLMLSGHAQREHVDRAISAGARGYLLKGDPYELGPAIRDVLAGEIYLSEPLR
jgi:DNA-binding NarL/FixJ family response regulator